jgi:3-hydroxyacyl-[acyl-carrier-protein] dehydratase
MRYQFIDKIKRLDPGKEIVIVKNVTVTEDFFAEHFVGFPVLPGALQIETMAQACGALIEITSEYRLFSILLMVEKVKFKKMVHPGDQMIVTARVVSQHAESALFDATIEVDGRVVTAGRLMVGIVTAGEGKPDFEKVIGTLREYFRFLLRDAEIVQSTADHE